MKKIMLTGAIVGWLVSGCTSVTVKPLDASYNVKHICIRENPKVMVDDMVSVITDGLNRHNIGNELILSKLDKEKVRDEDNNSDHYYMEITPVPDSCAFSLIYTARQSWDVGTYLSVADIEILNKSGVIASANYHLRMKGGYSLYKWQGTKTKLDPVMDELLKFYKNSPPVEVIGSITNQKAESSIAPATQEESPIIAPTIQKEPPIKVQENIPKPTYKTLPKPTQESSSKLQGSMAYEAEAAAMKLGCVGNNGIRPASNLIGTDNDMERYQVSCTEGILYIQCEMGQCVRER